MPQVSNFSLYSISPEAGISEKKGWFCKLLQGACCCLRADVGKTFWEGEQRWRKRERLGLSCKSENQPEQSRLRDYTTSPCGAALRWSEEPTSKSWWGGKLLCADTWKHHKHHCRSPEPQGQASARSLLDCTWSYSQSLYLETFGLGEVLWWLFHWNVAIRSASDHSVAFWPLPLGWE